MSIQYFQPIVWSALLNRTLDKTLVYAGAPCSNRDYEGEISAFGNSVKITHIADPTITPYTKDTNLGDPEALTDDQQTLTIDQANSFNFQIDDIDKAQVRNAGGAMDEATRRAAFKLRDAADQLAAGRMAAQAGRGLGLIDASTVATNVYDEVLVPLSVALDEANVPEEMRWAVLSPAVYGKLQLDARFIRQNEAGTNALHNGKVGDAAGFQLFKSNNAPLAATHIVTDAVTTINAKTLTSVLGGFRQSDIGSAPTGAGIGAAAVIDTVSADGTAATVTVNSTASATIALTVPVGTSKLVIAGSQIAHSFAQQILEVNAYKPEKRFGDALKGLHVFGSKVVKPEALVIAAVKTS
jgi:hypothetical protein